MRNVLNHWRSSLNEQPSRRGNSIANLLLLLVPPRDADLRQLQLPRPGGDQGNGLFSDSSDPVAVFVIIFFRFILIKFDLADLGNSNGRQLRRQQAFGRGGDGNGRRFTNLEILRSNTPLTADR